MLTHTAQLHIDRGSKGLHSPPPGTIIDHHVTQSLLLLSEGAETYIYLMGLTSFPPPPFPPVPPPPSPLFRLAYKLTHKCTTTGLGLSECLPLALDLSDRLFNSNCHLFHYFSSASLSRAVLTMAAYLHFTMLYTCSQPITAPDSYTGHLLIIDSFL